jgi:hypothetical protein
MRLPLTLNGANPPAPSGSNFLAHVANPYLWGARGDGVADDWEPLMLALTDAVDADAGTGGMILVTGGTFRHTQPLRLTGVENMQLQGLGTTTFTWDGDPAKAMLELVNCRETYVKMRFVTTARRPALAAVQLWQTADHGPHNSNHNTLRLWVDGGTSGFQHGVLIGGLDPQQYQDANNDYAQISGYIANYSHSAVRVTHRQSFGNEINHLVAYAGPGGALAALWLDDGYCSWDGGSVSGHTQADFVSHSPGTYQGMVINKVTSESSAALLDWFSQGALTVSNCRWAGNVAAPGARMVDLHGPARARLISNTFGDSFRQSGENGYRIRIEAADASVLFEDNECMQPAPYEEAWLWETRPPTTAARNRWKDELSGVLTPMQVPLAGI